MKLNEFVLSNQRILFMSDPITIIDNKQGTMIYYPDTKILHHTLHGAMHGQLLHNFLDEGTKVFLTHGATKWLSDD